MGVKSGKVGQNQVHGGAKGQKPLNFDVFRLFVGVQGVQGVQPFTPLPRKLPETVKFGFSRWGNLNLSFSDIVSV